ncbi:helix-turn-helix transcriptional regulator [Aneurinibacillus terranovensis]|uniref:helix-turn-helix transcriptional regulator n=1 Tax=Aneurinibacillus terranovensis TaxID=278991 RepID=UPI00041AA57A|nr:helix-turn-helix transcriptional regulator [Aneurinibacillus terranovensis]
MNNLSYTIEEIAGILKVSKLTVYGLIKKGKLPAYRVGRQMRVDAADLEVYKSNTKGRERENPILPNADLSRSQEEQVQHAAASGQSIIISGQDMCLDILAKHVEKRTIGYRPLRSYVGSLNSLISMYRGEADIVSVHLLDGDTGEYNVPYVRKILVSHRYVIVNLLSRRAGFYVAKGNPKQIQTWEDIAKPGVRMVNREKGSGARVLLDEQLRIHNIPAKKIIGYDKEESNHLGVAGSIASGEADAGIGIEKAAAIVGVDFIPLIKERYDIVMIKSPHNEQLIETMIEVLQSSSFQHEVRSIGGYDLSQTGRIIYETE